MLLLPRLPPLSPLGVAVVDGSLLTLLVAPVLYVVLQRPLTRSQSEATRGERLLLALSQAAVGVQRARTQDEIYRAVGDEVVRLGYHAMVFTVVADQEHLLELSHLTFETSLLRLAEKLVGVSAQGYRFPLVPGSIYQRTIAEREAIFSEQIAENLADALPRPARPLAGRVAAMLGLEQMILAPLAIGSETRGLLMVTGAGLTEADVPTMVTFANHTATALDNVRVYAELEERVRQRTSELAEANSTLSLQAVERERLIGELRDTFAEVATLRGLLSICASCKRIRDEDGSWQAIEQYIEEHSTAEFSHGVCDDCGQRLYGELWTG